MSRFPEKRKDKEAGQNEMPGIPELCKSDGHRFVSCLGLGPISAQ